nr:gliding motility-associated protein GldE [uncultured Porphyromonas sp.]
MEELAQIIRPSIALSAWTTLALSGLLLIISGFMSSSEVAFFSLSPSDIDEIKEEEHPADSALLELLKDSERLLATILIGNNLVNVAIVILTGYAFSQIFDFGTSPLLGFLVQTVILTLLLLLFGEIIPKVYAQARPLAFSRFSASKMRLISRVLRPFATLLIRSTSLVTSRMQPKKYDLSVDELSQAVDLLEGHEPEEKELFEEIINFHHKTASEIMVPRVDMCDIDISWDFARVLAFAIECGYSRIPIYEDSEDNIRGILYIKDLLPHKDKPADFDWRGLIREAYFIPENKPLDDLLEAFRSSKKHIAVVVDEYGGTSGIVTMEDLLEEIVGEISDEYDEEELPYKRLADGSYLFEGGTPLTDVLRALNLPSGTFGKGEDQVDTLGGLVLELKQDLPRKGDVVTSEGWRMEVTGLEKFRITEVKLTPPPAPTSSPS